MHSSLICSFSTIFFFVFLFQALPDCDANCEILPPLNPNNTKRENELLNIIKPITGATFRVEDELDPDGFIYEVNICSHVVGGELNSSAVQYTKSQNHTLGKFNMVDIMGGTDWILLTYYGGDTYGHHCNLSSGRVTKIMIICDPDALKGSFKILEERKSSQTNCYYLFELGSNVSCSRTNKEELPHKLSSGSVFCILFFTVISVYMFCGFLYKRLVIGAKGLEQIPNYSFWRDFGNLQADGCDYFCRCGPRQEAQAYRGIDDHLRTEEERDDQLLKM